MEQSQAFIRTGLLHVPKMDASTGEEVVRKLSASLRRVVMMKESYAASDRRWLEETLCKWCDEEELDLILTIGGTLPAPGPSALEVVPEATKAVIERDVPGLAEAMRASVREEFPGASLHRGIAGIRGRTLIMNLPGGSEAATLFLDAILEDLPYILGHLRGDAQAMTPAQIIREGEDVPMSSELDESDTARDIGSTTAEDIQPGASLSETPSNQPRTKGLNAEDFAAFLRRGKEGET